jgi:ribulose-5-phosphate 4-epimerase/fuculose-1-phosphate aldolase
LWRPHRLAYQCAIEGVWPGEENVEIVTSDSVQATALVTPAAVTALMLVREGSKEGHGELKLHGVGAVAVVDDLEGAELREALAARRAVMIRPMGLLAVGKDLGSVLNLVERIEQAAAVELNCELVHRARGGAGQHPEELDSTSRY